MSVTRKPRVFIASSGESIEVANAIHENLDQEAEVTVWKHGVFDLTKTSIASLLKAIVTFDFAIFVFAPDDVSRIRKKTVNVTRDNVIFELGLFMGELGEDRCIIVLPRDTELHLPTDLIGLTPAKYEPGRSDKNLVAALGPASSQIKRAMDASGLRDIENLQNESLSTQVASGLSEEFRREMKDMFDHQEALISGALARFEHRLMNVNASISQTAKAPISRITNIVTKELSPLAKALIFNIQKVHLSLEEYEYLKQLPKVNKALEELRQKNLLVPLICEDEKKKKIPVLWFHPRISRTVVQIIKENLVVKETDNKIIKVALKQAGYKYILKGKN